ncbi:YfcC family protein [Algoriphagus sp.]|uniref:YfcC family protein n=1 Tax=Algoriphagus sp. TaxID=1872435 RepID=UPI0032989F73
MKLSFPHPIIILLGFIFVAGLSTYFIQSGTFDRVLDEKTGREIVVPGSFREVDDVNVGLDDILLAIPAGIIDRADLVVLILLLGGAFYVIEKTGALQVGIESLIYQFRNKPNLLFYFLGFMCSICGGIFYMSEEFIGLVPIFILLAKKTNYDLRAILSIGVGSAIIGAAFSPFNPFGSLIAMKIAQVDPVEEIIFRMIFFGLAVFIWIAFHSRNGKLKSEIASSTEINKVSISLSHRLILSLTTIGIGLMIWGVAVQGWDYNQMGIMFFVIGFCCGMIGGLGLNGTARTFSSGFSEMIFAGVIIGLAQAIYLVLQQGLVIDPMIYALLQPLESLPQQIASVGLYLSQAIIHIPVPSTSGQAVLTMPLVTPLTDLLGMSREIAVLTFQYPATLMDMVTPTNGTILAVLAAADIKFNDWVAYVWKSWGLIFGIGLIAVIIALFWVA